MVLVGLRDDGCPRDHWKGIYASLNLDSEERGVLLRQKSHSTFSWIGAAAWPHTPVHDEERSCLFDYPPSS